MPTPQELETKFWQALKSDMTMMVGLDGVEDGHARPMTAQLDGERGPIWFFTAKDTEIVRRLQEGNRAIATFSSKGHDLFATVHGSLHLDKDRRNIDRLWNRFVPPGSKAEKTIPSWRCCVWTLSRRKSGWTGRAWSQASRCCSASIPRNPIRIRLPRWP